MYGAIKTKEMNNSNISDESITRAGVFFHDFDEEELTLMIYSRIYNNFV
uniref:Uncharacterized protein n=1 Tax=Lepeophtheirus salmonis TaxID=72036 RepID=A0A0K2UC86_LEPSM